MSGFHRLDSWGKLGSWENMFPQFLEGTKAVLEDFTDICFFGTRSSENTHFHHNLRKTLSFFS